ncbi:MAG: hypothetical protein JNL21_16710 [Myxococcales bacterium]|nr:hypothetical protein [Myxococcales bacterium]
MRFICPVIAPLLLACASSAVGPASAETDGATTRGASFAEASPERFLSPLQLGHYTTADGAIGLVFDRSSTPPRVKFDDSDAIVELTPEDDRPATGYQGITFKTPSGQTLLYVTKTGALTLWPKGDDRPLVRDGDAAPLPLPTISGKFAEPTTEEERHWAGLKGFTVTSRFPDVSLADSTRLDVVERVLLEAPDDLFFTVADAEVEADHVPVLEDYLGTKGMSIAEGMPFTGAGTGLARHGLIIVANTSLAGSGGLDTSRLEGYPPQLKAGTPGVIWSIDATNHAIFLSVDGGRYSVSLRKRPWDSAYAPPLLHDLPPVDLWPPAPQHPAVGRSAAQALAPLGGVDKEALRALSKLDDDWTRCAGAFIRSARFREVDPRNKSRLAVEAERAAAERSWQLRIGEACSSVITAYEKAFTALLDDRAQRLRALYQRVRDARAKRRAR